MKAMVIPDFGDSDIFEIKQIDKPEVGPNQLLVRVLASGTNPVDAKIRAGGDWAGINPPAVLGYDVSGEVVDVGPGVTGFVPGDEVYYTPEIFGNQLGSYAEYNTVKAAIVAHKPKTLNHEQAASVPLAGGTAWEAVIRRLKVQPGETILIHGGAGGVGSFAVQFAKMTGARVISTAGPDNQETLSELGADVALDYKNDDVFDAVRDETDGKGVEAVFDTAGHDNIIKSLPVTQPFGRVASILPVNGDLSSMSFNNQTYYGVFLIRESVRLQQIARVIDQGKVKPLVDQVLPVDEVGKAHERLDTGHGRGKVVLSLN